MFFGLVTKHACDRRTQTDGQNYNAQDCASIAASRSKNYHSSLQYAEHKNI